MSARAPKAGWIVLAGLVALLAAGRAEAQTQTCMSDADCPSEVCGGEVCIKSSGLAFCYPANTQGVSGVNDGWCADAAGNPNDGYCKCRGMGATCNGFYCTFTIPPTGGGGSGGGTSGGTTGSSGGGGCSIAGAATPGGAGIALVLAVLIRRRARRRS